MHGMPDLFSHEPTTDDATYVGVALDLPIDRLFTYRVPEHLREHVDVGHRVTVPFRRRARIGIVAEAQTTPPDVKVLDASTAHRVASGWTFGLPELVPEQRDAIRAAPRVSNPGSASPCGGPGPAGHWRPLGQVEFLAEMGPLRSLLWAAPARGLFFPHPGGANPETTAEATRS